VRSLSVVALLVVASTVHAQEVVVDWAAKKVTSQPSSVETSTKASVRVENINDIMFTYSISYQLKSLAVQDFDAIAKAFSIAGLAAPAEAASCNISEVLSSLKALTDAEMALVNEPSTDKGCSEAKPCNITLQHAKDAWQQSVQPQLGAAQSTLAEFVKVCSAESYKPVIQSTSESINPVLETINGTHSLLKNNAIELAPDKATSLEIDQLWKGTPTITVEQ
jgi:hypothetical protein